MKDTKKKPLQIYLLDETKDQLKKRAKLDGVAMTVYVAGLIKKDLNSSDKLTAN